MLLRYCQMIRQRYVKFRYAIFAFVSFIAFTMIFCLHDMPAFIIIDIRRCGGYFRYATFYDVFFRHITLLPLHH